jgi:CDP-diacylglycerol--serine O-phosphatidyltransferase
MSERPVPPSNGPPAPQAGELAGQRSRRRFRLRPIRPLGALGKWRDGRRSYGDDRYGSDSYKEPGFPPPAGPQAVARRRHRGFYLLPNAFTTASLFAGFYAVVMAMNDRFDAAAIAIFVAMLLDSLDGRVARLTSTQSAFGEQYDSLSDMVSFGAAPALIVYSWALKGMGKLGWVAAFIYVAGAALRLARFNTNIGVVDKRFFQGLPSPAAAALVVGLVWVATDLREARWITSTAAELAWLAWVVTVYAGITMVANVPFYSFKDLNFRRAVPFIFVLLLVAGFVLISSDPPTMLFLLFVVYGLSGYVLWGWRHWRGIPSPAIKSAPATAAASAGSGAGSAGASPEPWPPGVPSDHRGPSPHPGAASAPDGGPPRVSPGESPGPPPAR